MRKRMKRSRPSHGTVVAYLALFVALGGSAYAVKQLPKNSVGTKQLKKNAVNSIKVKNHSLKATDFKKGQLPAGPPGPKGDPGPAGALFGFVRDTNATDAVLEYGKGVSKVTELPESSSYLLTFDRSLLNCVAQANAGFGNPVGTPAVYPFESIATVALNAGSLDQLQVNFEPGDTSFMISVFC